MVYEHFAEGVNVQTGDEVASRMAMGRAGLQDLNSTFLNPLEMLLDKARLIYYIGIKLANKELVLNNAGVRLAIKLSLEWYRSLGKKAVMTPHFTTLE
ncbi:hypothetical protein LguiB_031747 [Lonicera macranthoides]